MTIFEPMRYARCRGEQKKPRCLMPYMVATFLWLWLFTGVAFCATPERIVSLAPNVTEILYELGLGDRVVAVTDFCDYPREASKKRKIGGFSNPSLEAIVAAQPDLVIMTDDGNPPEIFKRLNELRIHTYVFRAKRLQELPQGIRDMGAFLGVRSRAVQRAKTIEKVMQNIERKRKSVMNASVKKVIFIIQPEPLIAAGPGTVIDDVFALLGVRNIASDATQRYPRYSMEELIRRSPDVIFIGKGRMTAGFADNLIKRLGTLEAVKRKRVYYTSESLYRLTPRVVYGIEEIAGYLDDR
jgi:iron complex transport system substrate-binding protein